jgi:type IV fimbrial biogenesis protein FimT
MSRQAGVTVLEVVVSLLIIVLIIGIAAPTIQENRRNSRIVTVAADLAASVQLARAEAVRRQKIVSMCPTENVGARSPKCSEDPNFDAWIVFEDGDGDCLPVAGAVPIRAQSAVPSDESARIAARGTGVCISFAINGSLRIVQFMRNADKLLVCDARGIGTPFGNDPSPAIGLTLDPSGRVSQTRQRDAIRNWRLACPFGH